MPVAYKEARLQIGVNVIETGAGHDWELADIKGDEYPDFELSLGQRVGDGAYQKNARYPSREVFLQIESKLGTAEQINATQILLKRYMDFQVPATLTIYKNGVTRVAFGRLTEVKPKENRKTNARPYLLITFTMLNPYFYGEEITQNFTAVAPMFFGPLTIPAEGLTVGYQISGNDKTFDYTGDVSNGFVARFLATGTCVNPKIKNVGGFYVRALISMADGDELLISTVDGAQGVRLNGVRCSRDKLSDFSNLLLVSGENTLTVTADSGVDALTKSVTYREKFRG